MLVHSSCLKSVHIDLFSDSVIKIQSDPDLVSPNLVEPDLVIG